VLQPPGATALPLNGGTLALVRNAVLNAPLAVNITAADAYGGTDALVVNVTYAAVVGVASGATSVDVVPRHQVTVTAPVPMLVVCDAFTAILDNATVQCWGPGGEGPLFASAAASAAPAAAPTAGQHLVTPVVTGLLPNRSYTCVLAVTLQGFLPLTNSTVVRVAAPSCLAGELSAPPGVDCSAPTATLACYCPQCAPGAYCPDGVNQVPCPAGTLTELLLHDGTWNVGVNSRLGVEYTAMGRWCPLPMDPSPLSLSLCGSFFLWHRSLWGHGGRCSSVPLCPLPGGPLRLPTLPCGVHVLRSLRNWALLP
jgi:hypothetical protein